jgi:hypothetical protein
MKSVPNWISYLHEFFWNFSQHLAICFELFPFGSIFNSKKSLPRGPTRRPLSLPAGPSHQCAISTWPPRAVPLRHCPDRACPRPDRAAPTASPTPRSPRHHPDSSGPKTTTPQRQPRRSNRPVRSHRSSMGRTPPSPSPPPPG